MAESTEERPPTQSQVTNIFEVSMPNFATASAFVDTATKCLATDLASPPRPAWDQARADQAFVIVSNAVKVLEQIMNSVSEGSRSRTASSKSLPSTFETNRNVMERSL